MEVGDGVGGRRCWGPQPTQSICSQLKGGTQWHFWGRPALFQVLMKSGTGKETATQGNQKGKKRGEKKKSRACLEEEPFQESTSSGGGWPRARSFHFSLRRNTASSLKEAATRNAHGRRHRVAPQLLQAPHPTILHSAQNHSPPQTAWVPHLKLRIFEMPGR